MVRFGCNKASGKIPSELQKSLPSGQGEAQCWLLRDSADSYSPQGSADCFPKASHVLPGSPPGPRLSLSEGSSLLREVTKCMQAEAVTVEPRALRAI